MAGGFQLIFGFDSFCLLGFFGIPFWIVIILGQELIGYDMTLALRLGVFTVVLGTETNLFLLQMDMVKIARQILDYYTPTIT